MMIDAAVIGAYAGIGTVFVGAVFGYGKLNQKVVDMAKAIDDLKKADQEKTDRLSEGAVAFAEIREGLKAIREGQNHTQALLERMSGRLDTHIDNGSKRD